MYKTFRDANQELIEKRRGKEFPYFDLQRSYREQAIEELLDSIFEEFIDIFD